MSRRGPVHASAEYVETANASRLPAQLGGEQRGPGEHVRRLARCRLCLVPVHPANIAARLLSAARYELGLENTWPGI